MPLDCFETDCILSNLPLKIVYTIFNITREIRYIDNVSYLTKAREVFHFQQAYISSHQTDSIHDIYMIWQRLEESVIIKAGKKQAIVKLSLQQIIGIFSRVVSTKLFSEINNIFLQKYSYQISIFRREKLISGSLTSWTGTKVDRESDWL